MSPSDGTWISVSEMCPGDLVYGGITWFLVTHVGKVVHDPDSRPKGDLEIDTLDPTGIAHREMWWSKGRALVIKGSEP